jgi:hypothetical protein
MKLESNLYVCKTDIVPAGRENYTAVLKESNIVGLIKKLEERDINIFLDESEKKIKYYVQNNEKESMLPFLIDLPENINVVGYILRNNQLEIKLQDHFEKIGKNGNSFGGPVYFKNGIKCNLIMQGSYEQGKQIGVAEEVINDFYKTLL